jgi:shikimate dehydrogenase
VKRRKNRRRQHRFTEKRESHRYNTDAFGFEKTCCSTEKKHHKKALILGDGGAAKAVKYVMDKNIFPFVPFRENQTVTLKT